MTEQQEHYAGSQVPEDLDTQKLVDLELAVASQQIKDYLEANQATQAAEVARIRLSLVKIESMLGFMLAGQVTEMSRSPRPGEVVHGNQQTTKIKYFRSKLEEWLVGPWRKYLERAIDEAEPSPAPVDPWPHQEPGATQGTAPNL